MAITKLISQDSNEAVMQAAAANGEAMCSLIEHEVGIKSASSALVSRELLEQYRPKDDKTACIHLIAMGNSDQYGFNRNGDWFSGDVLEKRAHTFVTNGHMFREHRNKDPKKAIGQVKWAGYDPKGMQRVEIIVHMDRDKAEEEYDMIKNGEALNFSMSCRVPNDRCSCCGNEAKTISAYCPHLKSQMGQYVGSFDKYACAINDNPTFFDISRVGVPADRIARHLEYVTNEDGELSKSASFNPDALIPSALFAEANGVNLDTFDLDEACMLRKLAAAEEFAMASETLSRAYMDKRANLVTQVAPKALQEAFTADQLTRVRNAKPETLFREFAKRACVMSLPAFCQYISGNVASKDSELCKQASLMLPGIFGRMLSTMSSVIPCCSMFSAGSQFASDCDFKKDDLVQNVMDDAEDKFSVHEEPVKTRTIRIIIATSGPVQQVTITKKASYSSQAQDLAEAYAQYQVRALCDINELDKRNGSVENMCDIIVGSNCANA